MLRALFTVTLFVSAVLLFAIQPMFAKMVLPLLGGTPAVWNTCLVFYQLMLLLGYAYAHVLTTYAPPRLQRALHGALLLTPLCLLPIRVPAAWLPDAAADPLPWLWQVLVAVIGLPFFVVSSTAPLLQRWFASTDDPDASDPYFLYAASNAGSLMALLGYPLVVEPSLRLTAQSRWWAVGYGGFVLLLLLCAARMRPAAERSLSVGATEPLSWARRLRWVLLAAVPSSLLMGVTTYVTTDIAAIPLLWVVPLALYLLTFICVFAKRPPIRHARMVRLLPLVILPLMIVVVSNRHQPAGVIIGLHLLMLFVSAMICHGELAKDRPSPRHLTQFYLWMSAGGAAGGLFNTLAAPRLFDRLMEYPLAMIAVCLLWPGYAPSDSARRRHWMDYALPGAIGMLVAAFHLLAQRYALGPPLCSFTILYAVPALLCYALRHRPVRFGLSVGAFLIMGLLLTADRTRILHLERNFFGIYRVTLDPSGLYHNLEHGTTLHGRQSLDPARRWEPLTYFHPTGPLGDIFAAFEGPTPSLNRVAVIGLGTGSTACYASPGQAWTFYEIDPLVVRLAQHPPYFTFLRDCLERVAIVLGDARLSLAKAPDQAYDLLIVDAFSSDAIPVHLMTREALHLYFQKLSPGGVLAIHISNRYLRLEPVLGAFAQAEGFVGAVREDRQITLQQIRDGKTPSHWVVLAARPEALRGLDRAPGWRPVSVEPRVAAWTDDASNLIRVFRWR